MATNLKKFQNYSEYETYITGTPVLPNVSLCADNYDVYFKEYTTPTVSSINITKFEYSPTEVENTGGTATANMSYVIVYSDGSTATSGAAVNYKLTLSAEGATLDTTSGAVTWEANTGTDERTVEVYVTVSVSGISASENAVSIQNGLEVESVTVNEFKYSVTSVPADGGISKPTVKYTITYVGGTTSNTGATVKYNLIEGEEITFYGDSGVIEWGKNTGTTERNAEIEVLVSKGGKNNSSTTTITQKGKVVASAITINSFTYNPSTIKGAGGSSVAAVEYVITFSDGSTAKTGAETAFKLLSGDDIMVESTDGSVKWLKNTGTTERYAEISVTVSRDGKYASLNATITQELSISVSAITINSFTYNPSIIAATGGTAEALIDYVITYTDGSTANTGASTVYKLDSGDDIEVDEQTGGVKWLVNSGMTQRTSTITTIVSKDSKSAQLDTTITQEESETVYSNVGDIAYWDGNKISFTPYSSWTSTMGTPLAVCVIPTTHAATWGDGKPRFLSVKAVTSAGTESETEIRLGWGPSGDTLLNNYEQVPTWDNTIGGSVSAYPSGYLSSNNFTGTQNVIDTDAYYTSTAVERGYLIPSPYSGDGAFYADYTRTIEGGNMMSDLDGKANTNILMGLGTSYSAANACYNYKTSGTTEGDWYLPAIGELGYLIPKLKIINEALTKCGGITIGMEAGNGYWSSTEFYYNEGIYSSCLAIENGIVSGFPHESEIYTRPFISF